MIIMVAATVPMLSATVDAQTRCNTNRRTSRIYNNYENRGYEQGYNTYGTRVYDQGYNTGYNTYGYGQPNVYARHRKAMNIGIGAGAGALLGALIGGGKGALIGAAAGAGGGYVVTQKQSPRNYYRYRR